MPLDQGFVAWLRGLPALKLQSMNWNYRIYYAENSGSMGGPGVKDYFEWMYDRYVARCERKGIEPGAYELPQHDADLDDD